MEFLPFVRFEFLRPPRRLSLHGVLSRTRGFVVLGRSGARRLPHVNRSCRSHGPWLVVFSFPKDHWFVSDLHPTQRRCRCCAARSVLGERQRTPRANSWRTSPKSMAGFWILISSTALGTSSCFASCATSLFPLSTWWSSVAYRPQ